MPDVNPDKEVIQKIGAILKDSNRPMKERFRALFTLRNLGGEESIARISDCFDDPSALLKHELAYCLGQMQDHRACTKLEAVLRDLTQEPMVRHEAGEALGAIGCPHSLPTLHEFTSDPVVEVSETCQLAIQRITWSQSNNSSSSTASPPVAYKSVDPAPPSSELDLKHLEHVLLDDVDGELFERYRAMFALRNIGGDESVRILAKGLECKSALFRHEIAFVLGQLQNEVGIPALLKNLANKDENEMVRHECAEALGAIATDSCDKVLKEYLLDEKQVVRESCEVALDIVEYEHSQDFQYANALGQV